MLEIIKFLTFGKIGPKVKVGQKWVIDSDNGFRDRDIVTVVEVNGQYVKFCWEQRYYSWLSISRFRWLYSLIG